MNKSFRDTPLSNNSYRIRIIFVMGLILLFMVFIFFRLFHLQVLNHDYYLAQAAMQHGSNNVIPAHRGEIYFESVANQQPVLAATNIDKNLVFVIGKELSDSQRQDVADKLGPVLQIAPKDLLQRMIEGNQNYLPLKHQLSDDDSSKIKDLNLKGVYLAPENIRYYPQNNLASQVLGFLGFKGDNRVGQYGVEGTFEKQLAGTPGVASPPKNVLNAADKDGVDQILPAVDGSNIYLTIDPVIQFKVQQILSDTVQKHGADSGSVTIVNPRTGAIMAMANYPDFDPNQYSKVSSAAAYNNGAISADYEPGSIFKTITMAAGLNENKITPQSTFVDNGSIQVDDRVIKNANPKPLGVQTMTQVLDMSLNTGAAYVEQLVGHDKFKQYVQSFGFGKPVGFDLAGETDGNLDNLNQKGDIFYATASFGQGITVTPLQMIQAYSAIANGGQMMKPFIVDKIVHSDGTVEQKGPTKLAQILDPKTAATLSAMLVDVVENGEGKRAAVHGYYVGGKTGTAQVANVGKSGYDPNKNIGSFIGFGPVENPAFLMLVRIDNPKDVKFAESTAAPAWGQIASFILNYLQIPPTRQ